MAAYDWVEFSVDLKWVAPSGGNFFAEAVSCRDCLGEKVDRVGELVSPAMFVPGLAKVD